MWYLSINSMEQYLPDICIAGMCLDPVSIEVGSVLIMLGIIFSFSGFWVFLASNRMETLLENSPSIAKHITDLIFTMKIIQICFIAAVVFTGLSVLCIIIDCAIIIFIIYKIRYSMQLLIGSTSIYVDKKSRLDGIYSDLFHS